MVLLHIQVLMVVQAVADLYGVLAEQQLQVKVIMADLALIFLHMV
jgi:hypothetical protein